MALQLTIDNETTYRTADLRRLFLRGLKAMGVKQDKHVRVVAARYRHSGVAILGRLHLVPASPAREACSAKLEARYVRREGRWILMRAPALEKLNLASFCRVFEHEVLHNLGVEHVDMTEAQRRCSGGLPAWAEGLELRQRPARSGSTAEERAAKREAHARAMLAEHEAKLRREQNLVKKWGRRVARLEKAAERTAAGQAAPARPRPVAKMAEQSVEVGPRPTIERTAPGEYVVTAPDGYRFVEGSHVRAAFGIEDARDQAKDWIEPCPVDCDCRADEGCVSEGGST